MDGQKWLQDRIGDIRQRVAAGERVQVVFDIDDTLFDSRARTVALAKAWDAEHGTSYFSDLELTQVGRDGYATAKALGLPKDVAQAFDTYWDARFYDGGLESLDTPIGAMQALAHAAKGAGATVRYCTGRPEAMREATRGQLQRAGLPDVTDENLALKPTLDVPTADFKVETLRRWAAEEGSIGFMVTESRRDVAVVQHHVSGVPAVLLDHPREQTSRYGIADGTPVYRGLYDDVTGPEDSLWGLARVVAEA